LDTDPLCGKGAGGELYTQGAINTGDFDLVTSQQTEHEAVPAEYVFIRTSGPGIATRGWIHPALVLGFEVVGMIVRYVRSGELFRDNASGELL
jgi:hypothetical protein